MLKMDAEAWSLTETDLLLHDMPTAGFTKGSKDFERGVFRTERALATMLSISTESNCCCSGKSEWFGSANRDTLFQIEEIAFSSCSELRPAMINSRVL
jgi:hypothetical protein